MDKTIDYRAFGKELDAIHARIRSEMGPDDARYIHRINAFSRGMEAIGRILIHTSFEPVGMTSGVLALWIHKQLQTNRLHRLTRRTIRWMAAMRSTLNSLPGTSPSMKILGDVDTILVITNIRT